MTKYVYYVKYRSRADENMFLVGLVKGASFWAAQEIARMAAPKGYELYWTHFIPVQVLDDGQLYQLDIFKDG
jgi:hypothetical protein